MAVMCGSVALAVGAELLPRTAGWLANSGVHGGVLVPGDPPFPSLSWACESDKLTRWKSIQVKQLKHYQGQVSKPCGSRGKAHIQSTRSREGLHSPPTPCSTFGSRPTLVHPAQARNQAAERLPRIDSSLESDHPTKVNLPPCILAPQS